MTQLRGQNGKQDIGLAKCGNMGYRNVTCHGKTDGFGCQLNRKLSVAAYCDMHPKLRYIHHPFTDVSHGWKNLSGEINKFLGFPNTRAGRKVHVNKKYGDRRVFDNPSFFYTDKFLDKIRGWYSCGIKPDTEVSLDDCMVVHIRRGDIVDHRAERSRLTGNQQYNKIIPLIAKNYPDHYKIIIHSEGEMEEFESILDDWPASMIERTKFKLGKFHDPECDNNLIAAFHDLVSAKVLIQAKSGLSYTAGLLNPNEVWFINGSKAKGQRIPHRSWNIVPALK